MLIIVCYRWYENKGICIARKYQIVARRLS